MSVYQRFIESAAAQSDANQRAEHIGAHQQALGSASCKQKPLKPDAESRPMRSPVQYRHQMRESSLPAERRLQQQHQQAPVASQWHPTQQQQHVHRARPQQAACCARRGQPLRPLIKTDDPALIEWLQAMRFETELECLSSLQARTLAIDEHSASALSVRNSQVYIQEMRLESDYLLDYIDLLISSLPLKPEQLSKFSLEFSELWNRLVSQTAGQRQAANLQTLATQSQNRQQQLTIVNCTPRKSGAFNLAGQSLDKLANQIRALCYECFTHLIECQSYEPSQRLSAAPELMMPDSGHLEASLRKLKELYGKFVEISIRNQCANIVNALQYDFSSLGLASTASLVPVRPFLASCAQLPLKWALIALWQLTKEDTYICRTLTERWQMAEARPAEARHRQPAIPVARKLQYSCPKPAQQVSSEQHSLQAHHQKLYESSQAKLRGGHYNNGAHINEGHSSGSTKDINENSVGALKSALRGRQPSGKQVSTIELLIDIIISQPNQHERLDMMNFIHAKAQHDKLVDLAEWDQSVTAAIYSSNQYKVAALRILNHLCVNEQAIKSILRSFSSSAPRQGQPPPENKIIRSIFECYQTSQEHIYQNDTLLPNVLSARANQRGRKRLCNRAMQHTSPGDHDEMEENSDYGSRNTNTSASLKGSGAVAHSSCAQADHQDQGDDAVVKEAIRLLVQLTTPFTRHNQGLDFYTLIGRFSIDSLVKYLTNIIKSSTSSEMLLLTLTVLANISFITTEPMVQCATNRAMLEMFRSNKSRAKDLELRDQATTILANTADKNLLDIVNNAGLSFLLSCLESCPNKMANYRQSKHSGDVANQCDEADIDDEQEDTIQQLNIENKPRDRKPIHLRQHDFTDLLDCACEQQLDLDFDLTSPISNPFIHRQGLELCLSRLSTNELAALERIHQKTAVAFARMSVDPSTTQLVLKYGGVKQMIDMCKFSHKRNHSDAVLNACFAALRRMAKVIDSEVFRHYNALDLIELKPKQALEIYGAFRNCQMNEAGQQMLASEV